VNEPIKRRLQLYLIRHAVAEEAGPLWPDDALRPLTARGTRGFAMAMAGLSRFDELPAQVFTSPYVRARSTAALVAASADPPPPIQMLSALAPGHPPAAVVRALRTAVTRDRVALVGHEPDLGMLARHLLQATCTVAFKKGAMCRIDLDRGTLSHATLVWFLPPRVLRRLGRRG
jgi:phosphohistidine phosphatase